MSRDQIHRFKLQDFSDPARKQEVLDCLTRHGVFYLQCPKAFVSEHDDASRVFTEVFRPDNAALRLACSPSDPRQKRGFSKLESESTAQITNSGSYTDYSMAFSMGKTNNLFPPGMATPILERYFSTFSALADDVAWPVLEAAGLARDQVALALRDPEPLLRYRYYPEVPVSRCAETEICRMAPHYDLSVVTLIAQAPCANGFVSLQVDIDGGYIGLPAVDGHVLVFCGAVATLLTSGRIRAPRHQVAAPPSGRRVGSARSSSVLFLRPRGDFAFAVADAAQCGLDVTLPGPVATFREWIGDNYHNLAADSEGPVKSPVADQDSVATQVPELQA